VLIFFVTGAAGFIGSNMVDRLLREGHSVVGYDNLSTGKKEFLVDAFSNPRFLFVVGDLSDKNPLCDAMAGCDFVLHFAANADVRHGLKHPGKDLKNNTLGTFNVLESMRANGIRKIAFSSTGSVYGEADVFPTPENAPFPVQTSLYGASKLACEGLIQAYCEGYNFEGFIFRFVSILGERYTHGHVFDFYRHLVANPRSLPVLGDGTQRKSYLYVQDCVDAILLAISQPNGHKVSIYNLGTNEHCQVLDSIRWITKHLGVSPDIRFSGGNRGWVGDSPFIFLDCTKIRSSLGWQPKVSIKDGVLKTVDFLAHNPWLFETCV